VSLTQDLSIAGAFKVVAPEPVALKSVTSRVLFANNSAVLSAQATRQLLASLKTVSNPASVVVSGSVATTRLTATSRALATKRANAVAAIIRQQFAGVDVRVVVAPARGFASTNNNALVTFRIPSSKN
jgi:outer membrane protein OmpA-like peptidoglycan-associated protein